MLFIALVFLIILGIIGESHFCNHLHHTIFRLLKQSRFYVTCGTTISIHVVGKSDSHSLAAPKTTNPGDCTEPTDPGYGLFRTFNGGGSK